MPPIYLFTGISNEVFCEYIHNFIKFKNKNKNLYTKNEGIKFKEFVKIYRKNKNGYLGDQ